MFTQMNVQKNYLEKCLVFLSCLKVLEECEPRWKNPNIYKKQNFP